MKKKNPTIELLSELEKQGTYNYYNISPFISKKFKRPSYSGDELIWQARTGEDAYYLLDELKSKKYIYFKGEIRDKIYHISLDKDNKIPMDKWFDSVDFEIFLTLDGQNYLSQNLLIEATKSNLNAQKYGMIATILIAILAVGVSILTLYFNVENDKRIETLNKQISIIQEHTKP